MRDKDKNILLTACLSVICLMIAGIASYAVYGILFPPVWTEKLPFKNSTGQYD